MTVNEKYCVKLDVAYEIIASVHTDLCHTTTRETNITHDTCDILHDILKLKERLKVVKCDGLS